MRGEIAPNTPRKKDEALAGFLRIQKASEAITATSASKARPDSSKSWKAVTWKPKTDFLRPALNPGNFRRVSADQSMLIAMMRPKAPISNNLSTVQTASCEDIFRFSLR